MEFENNKRGYFHRQPTSSVVSSDQVHFWPLEVSQMGATTISIVVAWRALFIVIIWGGGGGGVEAVLVLAHNFICWPFFSTLYGPHGNFNAKTGDNFDFVIEDDTSDRYDVPLPDLYAHDKYIKRNNRDSTSNA